jgi:uncharacterized protein YcfJ
MNRQLTIALAVAAAAIASPAFAQITFYEHDGFQGRSFTATRQVSDFERAGFNDRASSVEVSRDRWEVCQDARFGGECRVLRPGRYPSLSAIGLNDRISSVRMVASSARYDEGRYAPAPYPLYDARRRHEERIYQADVTSVRAVVGQSEQHCWIERTQVDQGRYEANVPGAIAGAVIGGILGHQVGSGRGNDVATVGGAVAGGAIGANVGNNRGPSYGQDVQRCASAPNDARPDYWEVTYNFRGTEHRVQMATPPGNTVSVNWQGEPRA